MKRYLNFATASAILTCAFVCGAPAQAQVICETPADYPCDFQIGTIGVERVPPVFKFQSRVSQAKLPIGEGTFSAIYVKVLDVAGNELCREEFNDVTVRDSVLNLEIGHNMSCELEDVIAANQTLQFQICLGNQQSCLKAVTLAATPLSVKSTFSSLSEKAHQADFAGQAHYAHRLTADRNLLTSHQLGFGYFDFYTHVAADADQIYPGSYAADFDQYANGAFMQWTPVADPSAKSVHVVAKDQVTDKLQWLDDFVVFSHNAKAMGDLTVNERGDQIKGVTVTGDSRIVGTCPSSSACSPEERDPSLEVTGQVLFGYSPTALYGHADHVSHGIDGDLQIRGDSSNPRPALHVTGQVLMGNNPDGLKGETDGQTHGIHGDLEIIGDPTNIEPALQVTGQVLMGNNLGGLAGWSDPNIHGLDGDLQIRGSGANSAAALEVTGRLVAGQNPASLKGYGNQAWSGIDSALQVTEGLEVNRGGVTVGQGDVVVADGGLHVFGLYPSQIHGNTDIYGNVSIYSNGNLSVPTGRVETLNGLWLSDNSIGFQPAITAAEEGGFPTLRVNPSYGFSETHVNGRVLFRDQVYFEVAPNIPALAPAITEGNGISIDPETNTTDPNDRRISVDTAYLDNRYQRADGGEDIQLNSGRMIVFRGSPVPILVVSRQSDVAKITTAEPHGFADQSRVTIDADDDRFDATDVAITFIEDDQFSYALPGGDVSPRADSGTATSSREAPALSMRYDTAGAKPTLILNPREEFGTLRIYRDVEVVSGSLSVDDGVLLRNENTNEIGSALEVKGGTLVINDGNWFSRVQVHGDTQVNGSLRVSGGTLAAGCRAGMTRIADGCVDVERSLLSAGAPLEDAFAACAAQGKALCSADSMMHCKFHSNASNCGADMGTGSTERVLTSTLLVNNEQIENSLAVFEGVFGGFRDAQSVSVGTGRVNPAYYYCCTAATPGQ